MALRTNPIHRRSQIGNGGTFERSPQWKLDVKRVPDARYDLGGQQGMTSQLKEMVSNADPVQPKDVCPDTGEQFFRDGTRRNVGRFIMIITIRIWFLC
jgi:hypothetical protein